MMRDVGSGFEFGMRTPRKKVVAVLPDANGVGSDALPQDKSPSKKKSLPEEKAVQMPSLDPSLENLVDSRVAEPPAEHERDQEQSGHDDPLWAFSKLLGFSRANVGEPLSGSNGIAHQAGAYMKGLTTFNPDDPVAGLTHEIGAYLKGFGNYLKTLATWRLREPMGDEAAPDLDPSAVSMKRLATFGPQDPLVGLTNKTGAYLKSFASWRLIETKNGAAASDPDPLWRSLKNIATWRFTDESPAEPERALRFSSPEELSGQNDPVVRLAHQTGSFLKALASWRFVEKRNDYAPSEPDPLWAGLKSLATWRKPDAKPRDSGADGAANPSYNFDLLMSAFTRDDPGWRHR